MSRFSRQRDLVPHEQLANEKILLIGAGAVGRKVGNALAAIGAKNIRIIDMDVVSIENLDVQGYTKDDLGKYKALVLAEGMKQLDYEGDADIQGDTDPWRPVKYRDYQPTIVFCCIDNMSGRQSISKFCQSQDSLKLLIDTRMLGNTYKLLCYKKEDIAEYDETLFSDEEAEEGRCTRRSTIYAAESIASLAIAQLAFNLKGLSTKKIYSRDILDELVI